MRCYEFSNIEQIMSASGHTVASVIQLQVREDETTIFCILITLGRGCILAFFSPQHTPPVTHTINQDPEQMS